MSGASKRSVPPVANESATPIEHDKLDVLRAAPLPDISDLVGPLYTMDPGMRPLGRTDRLVGTAVTVRAPYGDNWAIYAGLSRCEAGHVLVVDWSGFDRGCGGGAVVLTEPARRGLAGVVIDGCWRDLDEVDALGIGVYGRSVSSSSPVKAALGEVNVPASCGRVIVMPGDVIVADSTGVVVVPRRSLDDVVRALKSQDRAVADPPMVAGLIDQYWAEFG